jgi:uncharacterized protein (TIGR03545 family)
MKRPKHKLPKQARPKWTRPKLALLKLTLSTLPRPKLSAVLGMKKVFRWQYVVPRAVVALAIILAVRYGLDPLLKYAIVAGGEAALGAKVDVAELSTSLLDGQIVVEGLAAANPQKPMRNLAEAEHMHLNIDFAALAHRRLVVKSGLVRGLKFDSERATSGALEVVDAEADAGPSLLDPLAAAASASATEWFTGLQGRVEEDLEAKLATPRVLREAEGRWKQQYEALQGRADALQVQAKRVETEFRDVKKNPLRGLSQLEGLQKELAATQTELQSTLAELKALPAQARADRDAVDVARKQDEQYLRDTLNVAKTDGTQLTEYLLGDLAHGYIAQSVGWVNTIRSWAPKSKMERPARARGTNVLFVDKRLPKCLFERVTLAGTARIDGQPVEITGELTDAATEPQFHVRPLQLSLTATGGIGGVLTATLDRRTGESHDTLVLDCPHLALGERTLGRADKLAVSVAPGEASLAAEVHLDGDQLSGFIKMHQSSTLQARTPALHDDRLAEMLSESLRGVDRLDADVKLSGTLRRPQWKIESNLGPQLADGINGAVRRYLADRGDRLVAKVQGKVDEQLAALDARRQQAQKELLGKLGDNQQLVGELATLMGGKPSVEGLAIPQIGSAIKFDRLKR